MTRRAAIVAQFDSRGGAAPHFLRLLDQISAVYDDVYVVSSSDLTETATAEITARARLIRRANYGHDFGSWRDALEQLDWAQEYDELLLTNDSYVGFFRPLAEIVEEMSAQPVEVWGMTMTHRRGLHIQSYFVHFTAPALHSQAFRRFWMDAKPAPNRMAAIVEQEVGLGAQMREAGFAIGAYFTPTRWERLRANARGVNWMHRKQRAFPAKYGALSDEFFSLRKMFEPSEADQLNTSSAFADSVFADGRLPTVKFDVLRNDPFWLNSARLLRDLERTFPRMMDGVGAYLRRVSEDYSPRPFENSQSARLNPVAQILYGYSARNGAAAKSRRAQRHELHTDFHAVQKGIDR